MVTSSSTSTAPRHPRPSRPSSSWLAPTTGSTPPASGSASATGFKLLQCGDPTGTGEGTPGYGFGVENAPKDGKYPRGTAGHGPHAGSQKGNGGQFFLVNGETSLPDPDGYSIFGTITKGLDIVDKVAAAGVQPGGESETIGAPVAPISILRVAVTEKKA